MGSLEILAVALLLSRDAAVPRARAIELAARIVGSEDGELALGALGKVRYDVRALREVLKAAVADSWDEGQVRPRGRPRGEIKRGARG
jgi:hypothetical protein